MADLSASRLAEWLSEARQGGIVVERGIQPTGNAKTYAEIAHAFGVSEGTVGCWRQHGAPVRPKKANDLAAIAAWKSQQQQPAGLSIQTSNQYLTAIKGFCRWLVRDRRMPENPLAHLQALNAQTDIRRERRVLNPHQFNALIESTQLAEPFRGLSGRDRATLYLTAAYTGLREGELASLTAASFDFHSDPPMVTVNAAYSKRRRRDAQPLRPEVDPEIRTTEAGI